MKLKQNVNNKTCKCECKSYHTCKNYYSLTPSTFICENSKYIKSTSVTECDELVTVMDTVSAKKIIATNVTSTASINFHCVKLKDCYILNRILLTIILLLVINFICYHYTKKKGII